MVIDIRFFATYSEKSTPKCADSPNRVFASYNEIMHFFVIYGEILAGQPSRTAAVTLTVFAGYKKSDSRISLTLRRATQRLRLRVACIQLTIETILYPFTGTTKTLDTSVSSEKPGSRFDSTSTPMRWSARSMSSFTSRNSPTCPCPRYSHQ